jgi:hypothetical protein
MTTAAVYAKYDLDVNYLALVLAVEKGVDTEYALATGGILPASNLPERGKWTQATVDAMAALRAEGLSYKAIGERYGQGSGAIYKLLVYKGGKR